MITKPEPYTIFNDAFSTGPRVVQSTTFWPFPRLCVELRIKIWTDCIPARRFIHVLLDNDSMEKFPKLYTTKNKLGNIISGCPYRMRAAKSEEWSPDTLIRVNHEARGVFRRICRVQIPLPVKGGDGSVKSLYISPENDIVWAVCDQNSRADPLLVSFLHDLVAYDPNGIGVVYLAMGGTTMNDIPRLAELDPSHLQLPVRESITKLLSSSLQTFHPVVAPGVNGRCMLGVMSWPHAQFHHNRSLPIFPFTQSYTCLECDPRPIEADLTHVAVTTDPRWNVFVWNRFKANFGVERHINIRYILSAVPFGTPVVSRASFIESLQTCDDKWAYWVSRLGQQVWGERMSKEEYEAQRTSLPQAAGFWSFPQEAFGDVPDVNQMNHIEPFQWEPKKVMDLSKFQPEIWVFNLP